MQEDYQVKKIIYRNEKISILTQNINGPCPLLAIANLQILKGELNFHSDYSFISSNQIISEIASRLFEVQASVSYIQLSPDENINFRLNDAINILPKFISGVDVNVIFDE